MRVIRPLLGGLILLGGVILGHLLALATHQLIRAARLITQVSRAEKILSVIDRALKDIPVQVPGSQQAP